MRHAFQTVLLKLLEKDVDDKTFKRMKASIYKEHKEGFYVYAKPNKCDPRIVTKYIGRYLGRPVIATSRIDSYDGEKVTFHYNRHEDEKYVEETIPALEFIERLIRHIPEKHFKMIRYYGLYARHDDASKKVRRAIGKDKHKYLLDRNKWRNSIARSFGYDPIQCPCCHKTMALLEIYFRHERVPLDEMYERVMANYKATHPPSVA